MKENSFVQRVKIMNNDLNSLLDRYISENKSHIKAIHKSVFTMSQTFDGVNKIFVI